MKSHEIYERSREFFQVTSDYVADLKEAISDAERIEHCREITRCHDVSNPQLWEDCSDLQREALLRDYCDKISQTMGINPRAMSFSKMKPNNRGSYEVGRDIITLNADCITDTKNRLDAMDTICHELRHAFQYEALKEPAKYGISQELADQWRNNLPPKGKYISPRFDFAAYWNQPIERDAREFAERIMGRCSDNG